MADEYYTELNLQVILAENASKVISENGERYSGALEDMQIDEEISLFHNPNSKFSSRSSSLSNLSTVSITKFKEDLIVNPEIGSNKLLQEKAEYEIDYFQPCLCEPTLKLTNNLNIYPLEDISLDFSKKSKSMNIRHQEPLINLMDARPLKEERIAFNPINSDSPLLQNNCPTKGRKLVKKKRKHYRKSVYHVIMLLNIWIKFRENKKINSKSKLKKFTSKEASKELGLNNKTMEYYRLQLNKAVTLGNEIKILEYLDKSFGLLNDKVMQLINAKTPEELEALKGKYKSQAVRLKFMNLINAYS